MQKRLDYGFNGYRVPATPRSTRSARGRGSSTKKFCENQMCAIELLATVAGNLLSENETLPVNCDSSAGSPTKSTKQFKDSETHYTKASGQTPICLDSSLSISSEPIKQELEDDLRLFKSEVCDQGSSDEGPLASRGCFRRRLCQVKSHILEEDLHAHNDDTSGSVSVITKCDSSAWTPCYGCSGFEVGSNCYGSSSWAQEKCKIGADMLHGKLDESKGYHGSTKCELKRENGISGHMEENQQRVTAFLKQPTPDACSSGDPMDAGRKPPALVSSDSSDESPLCLRCLPCSSLPVCQDDVKVVGKDDDDNSYTCSHPSNVAPKAYQPPEFEERKFRKLHSSKLLKGTPTISEDGNTTNIDDETRLIFRHKKANYKRQRTPRCPPAKRRRLFQQKPVSTSEGEGVSDSEDKCLCSENLDPATRMSQANGAFTSTENLKSCTKGNDAKVNLSIKSFKVPELFIEMPETATVGTLKRAIMEAVTSMLGDGLRVSILLQGKKVRDDTKTLLQTGFPCLSKLDDVGFMLEPKNIIHAPKPSSADPCPPPSPKETLPLNRLKPECHNSDMGENPDTGPNVFPAARTIRSDNSKWGESSHEQIISDDLSVEKTVNSRALIALPAVNMDALAVVPLHRKPHRAELVQRRIRRPFSVSEVEALVKAVEKIGTGRWRDVKLLAFDNAKHRTYVDLKDKWKTLVHTAQISPQQRRGEPVPQELLDRVLSAHAHWSQQQAKHQIKPRAEATPMLL
ncbi:telomere repeat-binding protein 5-like [Nymphaea colorata]|nr:telomere repeat-binding protein 5-like [Nymphaea colorata]XP_049934323.1 telomere repeat-binding protein 5-like [Nymphaea colorata]